MDALRHTIQGTAFAKPQTSPYQAVRQAAADTGVDFDYLWRTAKRESGLDPSARATTSSATGLFQFTNDTWMSMLDRYGDKYGIETEGIDRDTLLALREDPVASARMAGELANENSIIVSRLIGREATPQELYAAHFLGPSGAAQLINAARDNPQASAADLFPSAARANPAIFNGSDGSPRSVTAVYARLTGALVKDVDVQAEQQPPVAQNDARIMHAAVQMSHRPVVDTHLNAEEALAHARTTQSLMAALIGLQTRADDKD